jgi:hypothetical protein
MRKTLTKLLLGVILLSSMASAQDVTKAGTTAAKFLSIPVGPRALALGGAFVSIADDPTAMYWNVAGVSRITQNALLVEHTNWLADISFNYAGVVLPLTGVGAIGLNATALDYGQMDVTTEAQPEGTGETFTPVSYALGISFARSLTEWFSIGANVKYITERIWHSSADGIGVDIGTLFTTPFRGVRFGASITNFGSKMQISGEDLLVQKDIDPAHQGNNPSTNAYLATEKFDLPLALHIGVSTELTIAVDAAHPNDNTESVNLGAEYSLFDRMVALRGGYRSLFQKDSYEQFTLGAGINHDFSNLKLSFDYAYEAFSVLAGIHKFAFGILF